MKNRLSGSNVVETAAVLAIGYCASQAAVAGVRTAQFAVAGVKEFRKNRRSANENENKS